MQIHEITKGPQRTDEGILDDLKAAVTATKTGYAAGKANGGGLLAGLKGVAKNLTSRDAYNQALGQNQRGATNKRLDKLEKKWGKKIKRPLSYYVDQLKTPGTPEYQQAKDQREELAPKAEEKFIVGEVLPDPGHVLKVTASNGGEYFKDQKGVWYNANGQKLPATSNDGLNAIIDTDEYTQINTNVSPIGQSPQTPQTPAEKKAAKNQKPPANAAQVNNQAEDQPLQERASAKRKADRLARGITKTAGTSPLDQMDKELADVKPAAGLNTQTTAGSELQKAAMSGSQATAAVGDNRSELQKAAEPGSQANQELAKGDQPATTTATKAASTGAKPAKVRGKTSLRIGFEQWLAQALPGFNNITDKTALNQQFKVLLANKTEAALYNYILTAQAAILKAQEEQGIKGDGEEDQGGDNIDQNTQFQRLKQTGFKSRGDSAEDQMYKQMGIPVLSESQVAITKDIHVKTPKGDYVKSHTDQQWYDPNGVLIDQEKYADFVRKLDATPQAQTRYQADSEKGTGSDVGLAKAKEKIAKAKEQPPARPPVDPEQLKATAADWEEYKAEQNRINNQMIDKTVNDLRNAEYFNTGQQQYLQQQLAQQMAKKF